MPSYWEILPMHFGIIGLIGTIAVTGLSTWKVSVFPSGSPDVTEELWEGLWITCHKYSELWVQCQRHDSDLVLPLEVKASRWLMCFSIGMIVVALIVTGSLFHKNFFCCKTQRNKKIILAVGGSLFLLSFLTTLIPVCWMSHSIISDFYNPTLGDAQKRELGSAIYIGWATSVLLLITGVILLIRCSKCRTPEQQYYAEDDLLGGRDVQDQNTISLTRIPSSFRKNQEYV